MKILKPEVNGHDIEATVDGVGRIYLKSKLVKKI
ncbi:PhnA domain-containing protein [Peptoniphilus indolicus]